MTTTQHTTPQTGDIYIANVQMDLADDTTHEENRRVLLLDCQPNGNGYTVLWQLMGDELPTGPAREQTLTEAMQTADRRATVRLAIREHAGTYRPRDPQYNSAAILRDAARRQLELDAEHRERHRPADLAQATAAYRHAETQVDQTRDALYAVIRDARARGVEVMAIRLTTGLSRERIYQILDERR